MVKLPQWSQMTKKDQLLNMAFKFATGGKKYSSKIINPNDPTPMRGGKRGRVHKI